MDDESSGSENEAQEETLHYKHIWIKFCNERINKIEKVWNRKLDEDFDED